MAVKNSKGVDQVNGSTDQGSAPAEGVNRLPQQVSLGEQLGYRTVSEWYERKCAGHTTTIKLHGYTAKLEGNVGQGTDEELAQLALAQKGPIKVNKPKGASETGVEIKGFGQATAAGLAELLRNRKALLAEQREAALTVQLNGQQK